MTGSIRSRQAVQGALFFLQHNKVDTSTEQGQLKAVEEFLSKHPLEYQPTVADSFTLYDTKEFLCLLTELADECGLTVPGEQSSRHTMFVSGFSAIPKSLLNSYDYDPDSFTAACLPGQPISKTWRPLDPEDSPKNEGLGRQFQDGNDRKYALNRRSAYIILRDIDEVKHLHTESDYKYRDRSEKLKALDSLAVKFSLYSREKKTSKLVKSTGKILLSALETFWSSKQDTGSTGKRHFSAMWTCGTQGWKRDWLEKAEKAYQIFLSPRNWYIDDCGRGSGRCTFAELHPKPGVAVCEPSSQTATAGPQASPRGPTTSPLSIPEQESKQSPEAKSNGRKGQSAIKRKRSLPDSALSPESIVATSSKSLAKVQKADGAQSPKGSRHALRARYPQPGTSEAGDRANHLPAARNVPTAGSRAPPSHDLMEMEVTTHRDPPPGRLLQDTSNMNVNQAQDAMERLQSLQRGAVEAVFNCLHLSRKQDCTFARDPTTGLRELYNQCWGPKWRNAADNLLDNGRLSAFDAATALANAFMFREVFDSPLPWLRASCDCRDSILIEKMCRMLGVQSDDLLSEAASDIASNDALLQMKAREHAKKLTCTLRFVLTAHIEKMVELANFRPLSDSATRADWESHFDRSMRHLLEEALVLQARLQSSSFHFWTYWPEHGAVVDFARVTARYQSITTTAADLQVAFAITPGLMVGYNVGAGDRQDVLCHAEVVTQRRRTGDRSSMSSAM